MRMIATHYATPVPAQTRKVVASVKHVSAPLKGLSLSSKLTPGDPLTATILKNFVIEDDRINARAGYVKQATVSSASAVVALVPYYGAPAQRLAAASAHQLFDASNGVLLKAGFTSDDWDWTAFANLGTQDYTVMCNGADGVWSWDGGVGADPAAVAVTNLSNANPAVCTVAAADIVKFKNGQAVTIAGATTDHVAANGAHYIGSVNSPPNTFQLLGVDLSLATAPQTSGVTADPPGPFQKEIITAPAGASWIAPNQFQIVLSHMNRLWFADSSNLAVYYLPVGTKGGVLEGYLPLNALFKRGGSIKAMYTWTQEGGVNMNDQLVIFSTNGECVIYQGTDPETDFVLTGIFRFDPPMSKQAVVNYGGDLYVLVATGVVPLSTLLKSEDDQLGKIDRSVISIFNAQSVKYGDRLGWQLMLNPSSGRLIVNMPNGSPNNYSQMIRHMPRPVWSQWEGLPSRCWAWINPYLYFGDDSGNIHRMHPQYVNDNGQPIRTDVQMAWSQYGTPAVKHFKMLQPYMVTDGDPRPYVDVKVDYDYTEPTNQPDVTFGLAGAIWDNADWDTSSWAVSEARPVKLWQGVGAIGRVGGPRQVTLIRDCTFGINGWDVIFESGAAIG